MKTRNAVIGAGLAVAALLAVGLLLSNWSWDRNYVGHGPRIMGDHMGFPSGMHGFGGGITWLLLWAGLAALAAWLVSLLIPLTARPANADVKSLDAHEILDRRFVRGELSREEYEQMRQTLSEEI